ncbi:MAG: GNAT family N-acetyltransferase [Gammaproteobacteria bacterium]
MSNWQIFPASAFCEYAEQWDRLNHRLYRAHPMLDSRFVATLLEHFGDHQVLLAVYRGDKEENSNLLLLQPRKIGVWSTFLPGQAQIAPVLCGHPSALPDLFQSLPGFPVAIEVLSQDPEYRFSIEAFSFADTLEHDTTISVDLSKTFDAYWQERSRKLQQNIRRYFNRLGKSNIDFKLKIYSRPDELEQALHRYGELETKSWKGAAGTAINSQNEQGRFYNDVLDRFSVTNQAEIVELHLDNQLAASRINVFNNDMLITLKTTYDENLSNYAPGRLLLYLLIEREFTLKRVQHIEFYTNATLDQLSWSTGQRTIEHLTIYRSANIQRLFRYFHQVKASLGNS